MAIKKNLTDIAAVIETEDKVREKNAELIVEKIDVALLLGTCIILIFGSLLMLNVTWLQWVLFIPAAILIFLAIVSL
ncbi:MAG: hypothetical protein MJ209_05335 [archaeon]|nr:hypothetical protein [archaeon]